MGWQVVGTRRYFYRVYREGRRVRREYVGTGQAAEQAAAAISRRRAEQKQRSDELRALQQVADSVSGCIKQLGQELTLLADALLLMEGWHLHKRSEWRLRRVHKRIA